MSQFMEELKSAMNEHMDLMSDLVEKFSGELRVGLQPAVDNFLGFFHAIDWKETWLVALLSFHVALLLTIILSRKNTNIQTSLSLSHVNMLFSLCQIMVKWKRAELKHKARAAHNKQE
ncbi:hypothetical protein MKW92_018701 [Papaver armeniacum]|nr:hypothetical protein MKW92_018701 [Papaver armeniacum]